MATRLLRHLVAGVIVVGLACAGLAAIASRAAGLPDGPLPVGTTKPVDFDGLHNVVRLSEKLYSGGVPEGEAGFQVLQRFGIKTVICVDGAPPDVKISRAFKMRYVHLPFGYDGCPVPTANKIVRAVRDLPGPIYMHCHHGKNRSPAGAAFARIALDGLSGEEAAREMELAGAGKHYTGLYADVRSYKKPTKAEIDAVKPQFSELAKTPPMMASMVAIEKRFGLLSAAQKAGWKAPAGKPGVNLSYEALQLQELYTELNRTPEISKRPEDFRNWMRDGERAGKALEAALRAGKTDEASMHLGRLTAGCGSCHVKYRNIPQPR